LNTSILSDKSQSTPLLHQTPRTKHLLELEDQIKSDKFSKARVSHVSVQRSVISPNRNLKLKSTTLQQFYNNDSEIGTLKLYDHDVSYLQDAKNRLQAAHHGHKEHNRMFVDILVNNSNEESE